MRSPFDDVVDPHGREDIPGETEETSLRHLTYSGPPASATTLTQLLAHSGVPADVVGPYLYEEGPPADPRVNVDIVARGSGPAIAEVVRGFLARVKGNAEVSVGPPSAPATGMGSTNIRVIPRG